MSAAGTITEFLASVGFKADEKSLKSSLMKVAAFGVAVQTVAVGIYAGITRVASGEAEMARKAEKLGTTSDKLRELGYVAEQNGASIDAVTSSMEALVSKNPRIKDAAKALEVAGDRMSRMNDMQRKAYAARMGIDPSLIPALTSDVGKLKNEFRAMYSVASVDAKEAGASSKAFMAEIAKLSTMAGLLGRAVALSFIGRVRHDIEHLRRVIMENFDKIKRVFEILVAVVLRISAVISAFVYRAVKFVAALVQWFDKLDDSQKKMVLGALAILAAWKLLNVGFLATPLGAIIGGLLAIVALVDDYLTYMEGGESYFDWGPWAGTIDEAVQALKPIIGMVMGIAQGIMGALGPALLTVISGIGGIIKTLSLLGHWFMAIFSGDFAAAARIGQKIIISLCDIFIGLFSGLMETIVAFFTAMWPSVRESFPDFAVWAEGAAASITGIFGKAIDWVKKQLFGLLDKLPDWAKKKLGIKVESDAPDKPGSGPEPTGPNALEQAAAAAQNAALAAQSIQTPALTPSPAQAASLDNSTRTHNVQLNANTEIKIETSDPIAAGNQAADRQAQVNADLVRHTRGNVK